ncbi:hypothetical protein ELQ90_00130 [Labedella phragmitis]|uniref:Uncharacterized protein n=1 Tax=Labedella phragmitis TaxID=2498849 RepID=A0A444PWZ4_9MICO|nr:hypothetical protein [Labedella phragmitis]RWZ52412.1 hypothetical protein ELQ90_00130 [Labedella phragmitis]
MTTSRGIAEQSTHHRPPLKLARGRLVAVALIGSLGIAACSSTPPCDPAVTSAPVPQEGVLFGVNLDWGRETLAEYADASGSAPAVAVSFSDFPFASTDRENVLAAADQVASVGGTLLLTLEPVDGLEAVTDDALDELSDVLGEANAAGAPSSSASRTR